MTSATSTMEVDQVLLGQSESSKTESLFVCGLAFARSPAVEFACWSGYVVLPRYSFAASSPLSSTLHNMLDRTE